MPGAMWAWMVLAAAAAEPPTARWDGVGVGYDHGLWGTRFAQSVSVDVPVGPERGRYSGVRLRAQQLVPVADRGAWRGGGGVELFGRGPVLLGILRVYGGGGVWTHATLDGDLAWSGGGHYGLEARLSERSTFRFEIGGQGGSDPTASGASAVAGMCVWLGRGDSR